MVLCPATMTLTWRHVAITGASSSRIGAAPARRLATAERRLSFASRTPRLDGSNCQGELLLPSRNGLVPASPCGATPALGRSMSGLLLTLIYVLLLVGVMVTTAQGEDWGP
jgi:hypothetical protein